MRVRVRCAGFPAKSKIGDRFLEIADGSTLFELLELMAGSQPDDGVGDMLIRTEKKSSFIVLKNGRLQRTLQTPLADGDEICLLLPLEGG